MHIAKVFEDDGAQTVRLPKDFRFEATEVRIRRHGAAMILEPLSQNWAWLTPLIGSVDADFEAAAVEQPTEQDH
ncbi:AbrB/MazE/SpoVT family DNA-binding domain-containing protein [Burkholderia sp. Bp8963]|uniref:antitoxin n=1 Tax=Burkholderia sp. Bp8963 TaxID=2184547 RepID=UPI000F59EBF0|nr:AbrB/MazE/SpoVT family DNA-binding domain-containing protein [Burkholderia sp. Bp8963]RQS74462.1 AbrB/MazE/SpoVT family DNA-binding domain-containing protein [Burkholderia sp. Bp8963]